MNKPIYVLPFIFVYKVVSFIFNTIGLLIRYSSLGLFFTIITIISVIVNSITKILKLLIYGFVFISSYVYKALFRGFFVILFNLLKYVFHGFICISYILFKFIRYVIYGLVFPFILVYYLFASILGFIRVLFEKYSQNREKKRDRKERLLKQKEEEKKRLLKQKDEEKKQLIEAKKKKQIELMALKEKKLEEEARIRQEKLNKKKAAKEKDEYLNEKVKIEKKSFGERINSALERLIKLPENIIKRFKDRYRNLSVVKNAKNKLDISRQALLINFESEDAVKSDTKILYEYVAKNTDGQVIKGYFEAFSKVEVHSYLLSEGYEVYSIRSNKWITFFHGRSNINATKIKNKDLIFFITQLSTYIKAGIPLVEALKILTRQFRQRSYQRIFKTMIYDLTMGESFSSALDKQGVAFPRLFINMVKAAEMTGELPEVLDDMAEYYTEAEKTRKQMVTAMIYPSVVFIMSIAVITFIIMFVVPKFIDIYKNMNADQIPEFTKIVIRASEFLEKNIIWVFLIFAAVVLVLNYLYKNVKIIRTFMQWLFMHAPGFGKIIIYNEVTIFTKTFSSLLAHNVFITESMEVLNKITNNEIYKMIILDTITNLAHGDKISTSFQGHWAFPIPAYEMLVTGEKTGQLPEMMAKVADYYQELHKNAVTRLKTLIEPMLLVFLTFVVGTIILSVILPMFGALQMVK